jgi:BON domain
MDDSERSYGYSRDLYHGARGVGGHYAGGHSEMPHFERSYEYGAEGQADETSPEEAAMHVIEGTSLRIESGGGTGGQYDYDRGATYGQVESFTWDLEGPHRGRGPRGARRSSDDRIRDEICDRLEAHGAIDATDIDVKVENGEVTLEGTVSDRRSKRLAQSLADSVRGVEDVHNRLRLG